MSLHVLVLAGTALIFFAVDGMGLWFVFVLETVFIIQGCFCYCWAEPRPSLLLTLPHQGEAEGAQGAGRGKSQDS